MCTACNDGGRFSPATATPMPTHASEKALAPIHPRHQILDRRSKLTQPRSEGRTRKSHTRKARGALHESWRVNVDDRALCCITQHDYLHHHLPNSAGLVRTQICRLVFWTNVWDFVSATIQNSKYASNPKDHCYQSSNPHHALPDVADPRFDFVLDVEFRLRAILETKYGCRQLTRSLRRANVLLRGRAVCQRFSRT